MINAFHWSGAHVSCILGQYMLCLGPTKATRPKGCQDLRPNLSTLWGRAICDKRMLLSLVLVTLDCSLLRYLCHRLLLRCLHVYFAHIFICWQNNSLRQEHCCFSSLLWQLLRTHTEGPICARTLFLYKLPLFIQTFSSYVQTRFLSHQCSSTPSSTLYHIIMERHLGQFSYSETFYKPTGARFTGYSLLPFGQGPKWLVPLLWQDSSRQNNQLPSQRDDQSMNTLFKSWLKSFWWPAATHEPGLEPRHPHPPGLTRSIETVTNSQCRKFLAHPAPSHWFIWLNNHDFG